MKPSARNQFPGTVASVKKWQISTSVKIEISAGLQIASIITTEAALRRRA